MKTLIICRHAKADYPPLVEDFDRPLKEKGEKDAKKQGQRLAADGFMPDVILSSPANRAISTAKIVAKELGYDKEIQTNKKLYFESVGTLLDIVQALPMEVNTVMIFGHNPTMSDAVRMLLNMYNPFEMPTSGMVCLENDLDDWQFSRRNAAKLRWNLVPRLQRSED